MQFWLNEIRVSGYFLENAWKENYFPMKEKTEWDSQNTQPISLYLHQRILVGYLLQKKDLSFDSYVTISSYWSHISCWKSMSVMQSCLKETFFVLYRHKSICSEWSNAVFHLVIYASQLNMHSEYVCNVVSIMSKVKIFKSLGFFLYPVLIIIIKCKGLVMKPLMKEIL